MHLHREITDGIAGTTQSVDEYFTGSRVISIRGTRTVIVDYSSEEITEIDRGASTYSITTFEEVAKSRNVVTAAADADDWTIDTSKANTLALHRADEDVEVDFDPSTVVTSGAVEVLIGSRYPNSSSSLSRAIARSLRRDSGMRAAGVDDSGSSLPLSITHRYRIAGASAEVRNRITRVDHDALPPAAAEILPGYRRIESRFVVTTRELRDLDSLHPLPREP